MPTHAESSDPSRRPPASQHAAQQPGIAATVAICTRRGRGGTNKDGGVGKCEEQSHAPQDQPALASDRKGDALHAREGEAVEVICSRAAHQENGKEREAERERERQGSRSHQKAQCMGHRSKRVVCAESERTEPGEVSE